MSRLGRSAAVTGDRDSKTRGAVIGIDVGCSPTRRSSAVCRLEWDATEVRWQIKRFRAASPEREQTIARVTGDGPVLAAALDGPLRREFDVVGRYRTAERLLTRRLQPLIGKPGQASAPVGRMLNAHANNCARVLLGLGVLGPARHPEAIDDAAIVEAFPSSFLGVLLPDPAALGADRGNRSDVFYKEACASGILTGLIGDLLPGRRLAVDPSTVTNHDDRAAFVCALTALGVALGDYTAVGDSDGWIVLPPKRRVQPWAWSRLRANAADESAGTLVASQIGVGGLDAQPTGAQLLSRAPDGATLQQLMAHVGYVILFSSYAESELTKAIAKLHRLDARSDAPLRALKNHLFGAKLRLWHQLAAKVSGEHPAVVEGVGEIASELEALAATRNLLCHAMVSASAEPGRPAYIECRSASETANLVRFSYAELDLAVTRLTRAVQAVGTATGQAVDAARLIVSQGAG